LTRGLATICLDHLSLASIPRFLIVIFRIHDD
jgi:hypothetical protein